MRKFKSGFMAVSALVLTVCLLGFSAVSAVADGSGLAMYVSNDLTITGGNDVVDGDAVVLNNVSGVGWSNRVENGMLYADPLKVEGYQNEQQRITIKNYLSTLPYSGEVPNINVTLGDFPSLTVKDSLPEANAHQITESGWYDEITLKNNGTGALVIVANEGEVIKIRVNKLTLNGQITVVGSGTVLFYINKLIIAGTNNPSINNGGNAKVGLYLADSNEISINNTVGNFSIYSNNSNIKIFGSSLITGNIYLNGKITVSNGTKIIGYVGGNNLDADILGGLKDNSIGKSYAIEGRLVANNVKISSGPIVKYGSVVDINDGLAKAFAPEVIPDEPDEPEEPEEPEVTPDEPPVTEYVQGLKAEYYDAAEMTNESALRKIQIDARPFFNWQYGSPDESVIEPETFAVRWSGFVKPTKTAYYTFKTLSDDGVRLSVNNTKLLDRWGLVSLEYTSSEPVYLEAGVYYPIALEYQQLPLNSLIYLFWETEEDGMSSIAATELYIKKAVSEEYLTPKYFNNILASGEGLSNKFFNSLDELNADEPAYSEIKNVAYDWGLDSPNGITEDAFYATMEGYIEPKYTEVLTLSFEVDDAIKVWVDGNLIIDSWNANNREYVSGTFNAQAGKKSEIKIEYADLYDGATCIMRWESELQNLQNVPTKYLYTN